MIQTRRRPPSRLVWLIALFAMLCTGMDFAVAGEAEAVPPKLEIIGLLKARDFAALEARLSDGGRVREGAAQHFSYSDPALEADLDAWVAASPGLAMPYAARAAYYDNIAWLRRGGRYASSTRPEQFAAMRHYFELSARDYSKALALDDGIGATYAALIYMAYAQGDEESAARFRREGLDKARNTLPIHMAIIGMLEPKWGGAWEQLEAYISDLQRRHPADTNIQSLSGHFDQIKAGTLYSEDKYAEALTHIERAIGTGDTASRQHNRALILAALERREDALKAIEKALVLDPNDYANYTLHAGILYELGRHESAYRSMDVALALDPYRPFLLSLRATYIGWELYNLPSDVPQTHIAELEQTRRAHLNNLLVHGAFDAAVHLTLGEFHASQADGRDQAIEHHLRSVKLMPRVPAYWQSFAKTLLRYQDCRAVETARRYLNVCKAAGDCTPNRDLVETVMTNLVSCQAPQIAGDVELPLAPRRTEELGQLLACRELFTSQSDDRAMRACLERAEAGDADAQFDMGMLYMFSGTQLAIRGAGAEHLNLATDWLSRALAQNHVGAMAILGNMYLHGIGVPRDSVSALALLGAAAERGHGDAAMGLGIAYHRAIGVPKDVSKAEDYYRKAIELGNERAGNFLEVLKKERG